jgi:subtilase family serine protease
MLRRFAKCLSSATLALALSSPVLAAAPKAHTGVSPQFLLGPRAVRANMVAPRQDLFTCQVGLTPFVCYDPFQLRTAYGVDKFVNAGFDGTERTIVIVDAFQSPTLVSDVDAFAENYSLPPASAFLTQIAPDGLTPFDPNDDNMTGWSGEITLDVEWAHAVAPGAKVVLVLAKSNDDADILSALRYAVDHNLGDVISMSFGENESCVDPDLNAGYHEAFADATRKSITLFASSGDQGAAQTTCDGNSWVRAASSPANDPLVSGVGGTELHAADYCLTVLGCDPASSPAAGTYQGEIAWNEFGSESTGGGYSVIFDAPAFQKSAVKTKGRAVPDVAYNAAIEHGVLVYWQGDVWLFGGTSAGAPQWSAITAISDQVAGKRLGYLNAAFYKLHQTPPSYAPSFHDITSGNNSVIELDADNNEVAVEGFPATLNWDATTGIGSPKADGLVARLINATSPGDGTVAIATSKPHGHAKPRVPGAMDPH